MASRRILIVEPDGPLALSIAALFRDGGESAAVAGNAGEAELEIALRRPDLVVVRAELPDLSGFSLCAHLRHDRATARLPIVIYSSETGPASLADHARTPWAASGYLAMPLDTAALAAMSRRLLAAAESIELVDDADVVPIADGGGAAAAPGEGPDAPAPNPAAPPPTAPPPVRRAPRHEGFTEEDRLAVDRVFRSLGARRDEPLEEPERRRPPPRPEQLASPEGRLQRAREDLRWREGQLARLAAIWEARERDVAGSDERVLAGRIEAERARGERDEARRRLDEARRALAERDREHGASIEGMLLERFREEKELIEIVAGAERRLHEQARELAERGALAAEREAALGVSERRAGALEEERRRALERIAALEGRQDGLDRAARELAERVAELLEQVEARDALLRGAQREVERLRAEQSEARQALMIRESDLAALAERARSDAEELRAMLGRATGERDEALARLGPLADDLAAARAEAGALGEELELARRRSGAPPARSPAAG